MCNGIIILYLRMHYRRAYYIHACHMPHAAHMLSCHCIMHLHLLAVAAAQNSWNIRFACCDLRFMPPSRRASATPALCLVLAPRLCLWFVCAHIFHFVPIRFVFAKYQRIPRLQAVRSLTQYVPLLMPNVAGNTCTQRHVSTPIQSWVWGVALHITTGTHCPVAGAATAAATCVVPLILPTYKSLDEVDAGMPHIRTRMPATTLDFMEFYRFVPLPITRSAPGDCCESLLIFISTSRLQRCVAPTTTLMISLTPCFWLVSVSLFVSLVLLSAAAMKLFSLSLVLLCVRWPHH